MTTAYRIALASAATLTMAIAAASHAQESAEDAAAAFGQRESVLDISLSPSGSRVAYIAPVENFGEALLVVDLEGDATPRPVSYFPEALQDLQTCDWANDDWLVCRIGLIGNYEGVLLGANRMVAIAADGSSTNVLSGRDSRSALQVRQDGGQVVALDIPGKPDRILMTRDFVPQNATNSRITSSADGLGLVAVELDGRDADIVERPDRDATAYIADDKGQVRLKVERVLASNGEYTGETRYRYRPQGEGWWEDLPGNPAGFQPVTVDAAKNTVYGYTSRGGFTGLSALPLDGSTTPQDVLVRDDVDVDSLIRIGRQKRVVGASFATEKRQIVYFDEALKSLASGLQKALPGNQMVSIEDASADESKLLVIASNDTNPGMAYLFDKSTKQLSELLPLRKAVDGRPMAAMQAVTFPADDGTQIPGYLTLPTGSAKPGKAIVMPHGGPGARDEWGFDWMVQFFASQGYAVLQPNFRGSTGYGEAWFGRNGFQAWETAISDVNAAGRWLVSQGISSPESLAGVGWSYGGYAVLQSQVLDPDLFRAIVAIAPVTDLERLKTDARHFRNASLVEAFVGNGPHVDAGSPADHADRFQAPVLLFHGTHDLNVNVGQSRMMEDRLKAAGKPVELVIYEERDHSIDDSWARGNMLLRAAQFLDANLP